MNDTTKVTAPKTISMYEHEEEVYRLERYSKRLFFALMIAMMLLFITNVGWLVYEGMFDTVNYSQDGEGINNINTGTQGDVLDGTEIKDKDSKGS